MKKLIAASAVLALALTGIPQAAAFSFGSSGSSTSTPSNPGGPVQSGPEKRIREAAITAYQNTGFTLDAEINTLTQQYVKASGSERDQIMSQLHALGVTTGSGGSMVSNEQALVDLFDIADGIQLPPNGKRFGVGVDFGAVTTEIQIFIAE